MPVNKTFTDQIGEQITVSFPPCRIISIVPSLTELLFDLGLDERVVGITKFCVHPEDKFRTKPKVGGTKKINLEKIRSLQPDLIIANKEENEEQQVKELMNHFPVWISDIKTLDDAYEMIEKVGALVDKAEDAKHLVTSIKAMFHESATSAALPSCAYLIWRNPYMAAGNDTFINSILEAAGFKNVIRDQPRYPEITIEKLKSLNPEYVLLSSEPYPFSIKHKDELQNGMPGVKILLVDGEMFSWYGSRMLKAGAYFRQLRNRL
ncbi:MAG: helical backbone metal receptor [Chitinophagales bacterium]